MIYQIEILRIPRNKEICSKGFYRRKAIRGRTLGTDYTEEYLKKRFQENLKAIKYPKAFTMHTNLPFVRDLHNSAITITNRAYDRKVKINNLKETLYKVLLC